LELIPQDLAHRYVVKSCTPLSEWFPALVQLLRGLTNKNWDAALDSYTKLSAGGVVFTPSLLSRFLELCKEQSLPLPNPFIQLHKLAREVLQKIRDATGSCSVNNYRAVLRILDASKEPVELLDVYQSMKADGHLPSHDIIHLVLRGGACTDNRILQLLNDSKMCLSTSNDIARVANSVLEKVSPQLLSRNKEIMSTWISGTDGVLDKMGRDALVKLFDLFVSAQNWSSLLVLLEQCPKAIAGLEPCLCDLLTCMVSQQPALSDRAAVILEMMSNDALSEITAEGWNIVLTQCVMPATSQRTTKFCRVLSLSSKCLSQEALDVVLGMVIMHSQPAIGMEVLGNHLKFIPPVVPSMTVLSNFCKLLEQNACHKDLYSVVCTLLQCKVAPSLTILQSFVNSCNQEKTYSRLAVIVKKARESGLCLEKTFYQRALVILRQWGQDQSAISTIYKALRTIDTVSPGISAFKSTLFFHGSATPPLRGDLHGDSGRSTTSSVVSGSSSRPHSSRSNKSRKSLEGIFETSEPSTKPGLLALLESNGRQGQFGAMLSILLNLRDNSKSTYGLDIVQTVWRAITESEQKPANVFSCLLEQFKLSHTPTEDRVLCPCDHWLVSQLGIALLYMYADTEHWQSGFVILHHLHRHKIHYIANCEPIVPLPPLKTPLPSPCDIARTAVTTCLKINNIEVAVNVLRESEWMSSCSPEEYDERTRLLLVVAERCLDTAMYKDCCRCLQELNCLSAKNKHFAPVLKLNNRLLKSVLSVNDVDLELSVQVYNNMNSAHVLCAQHNFSLLLEKLCDSLQQSTARDLCKQAVDKNFYPPLTHGDLFSVCLPPSIHHVEVCTLIQQHLHRMSQELEGKLLQPLAINFEKGMKDYVEQALTRELDPSLTPSFSSGSCGSTDCATISSALLLQWLSARFPASTFHTESEEEGVHGQGLSSVAGGSNACCSNSVVGGEAKAAAESRLASSSGVSTLDIPTSDSECSAHHTKSAVPLKQQRKQFREAMCRMVVSEVKPFYMHQPEKFNSYEDYIHLLKVLTANVCKSIKSKPSVSDKWTVTDSTRNEVRDLVNQVMSKCTTYTPELDIELFG
jgi:hypothetical protein